MEKKISRNPKRRWVIESSEEQLQLIRDSLADIHLFLRGNATMAHTVLALPNRGVFTRPLLSRLRSYIAPDLAERFPRPDRFGEDVIYSWSGHDCPIERQQKKIALSHAIHSSLTYNLQRFLSPSDNPSYNPRPKATIYSGEPIRCHPGRIVNRKTTPNTSAAQIP
ncbi:MAG: hypothetical protein K2L89_03440 [Muribaculaceae bacterium]|nr:hypothetical protein [Muribaculaceae bacterium]